MFTELTLPQYLEKMAGTSFPSPKGGSALAITGAMGASLTKMCSQVSANKKPEDARYRDILEKADVLQTRFLELADDDTRVVYEMIRAGRETKNGSRDCEIIQKSYLKASDSLFYIGEAAKELIGLAQNLRPLCASSCIIDLEIVEVLAKGIKESVVRAIGDNYRIIEDKGCRNTCKGFPDNCPNFS